MNNLVSVVVPTYNAEKYLQECINSLLAQTYDKLEIIFINDGSTDGSLDICNKNAARNSCIKVFNQDNAGVSAARNKGIDIAKGKYICFVDADDTVSPEYIYTMLREIIKYNADLAICGHRQFSELNNSQKIVSENATIEQSNIKTAIDILSIFNGSSLACWDKMFRLDIIKKYNIYFNKNIAIGEDSLFNIAYLEHATNTVSIPNTLYNYRVNIDSTLRKDKKERKFNPKRLDVFKLAKELNSIVSRMNSKELKQVCGSRIYINTRDAYSLYLKYEHKDLRVWRMFTKQLRSNIKYYLLTIISTQKQGIKRVKKLPKDLCLFHAPSILRLF